MNKLSTQFFKNNRIKLIKSLPKDGIVIVPGNGLLQRTGDTTFSFRQDSNFYYLCGLNEPNATLVIDTHNGSSYIMLPIRTGINAIFDGIQDVENLKKVSGADEILDEKTGWQRLRLLKTKTIYMPQKPKLRVGDMYVNPHREVVYNKVRRLTGTIPTDIRPNLAELRVIKTTEELSCIQEAVQITLSSIDIALKSNISTESQLEAELTKQFCTKGASGHAYKPIVACGVSSCTLHYVDNNAPLQKGQVLLLDVGAEVSNYAADISRTVVWGCEPSGRQQAIIDAVRFVQTQLISYLKPGIIWKEFTIEADRLISEELIRLGLLNKSFEKEELRRYFPHSVSHFLGLDVHDVGDYNKQLQKGMVITVEPGIYITDEEIGVRIEDDVVITDSGAKIIS